MIYGDAIVVGHDALRLRANVTSPVIKAYDQAGMGEMRLLPTWGWVFV